MRSVKLALLATAFAGCCVVPLAQGQQWIRDGNGTTSVTGTVTINPPTINPPLEDLVISARNEGLVLIRGIANCASVASALNNSSDVQHAVCRKPYVGATTSTSVYTVKP